MGDVFWGHPCVAKRVISARHASRENRIFTINPYRTNTDWFADRHFAVQPGAEPLVVEGTYLTNFGPLYLEQAGDRVRGCYDDGTASVSGLLEGRLMRLQWSEKDGSGDALLTLSSRGDLLNGLWYEGTALRGTWRGTRDPGNPEPLCEISAVAWVEE